MFSEEAPTFYFEDQNRKKKQVINLSLPPALEMATVGYLAGLKNDKKLKLTAEDLLFIQDAVYNWRQSEAIRTWEKDALNEGFRITASGLAYKVITEGMGPQPQKGQQVKVHYTGYLIDGKKFDSSLDRMQPFLFPLGMGRVIRGWDEGVALMRPGSRFLFRIPPELGYGSRAIPGTLPANSVLYFDVRYLEAQ